MDKITYLAQLAEGLARWVPERERQDILRYYAEYFEEAGPGREGEVVAELGDPWALSCRLAVEGGFVTQEQANSWTPPKRNKWPWVLAAALACVAVVGMSVAYVAAQVGRIIGGNVAYVMGETTVAQVEEVFEGTFDSAFTDDLGTNGFWSERDGTLLRFASIDADIKMGNITVSAGDDFTLSVQQSSPLNGYRVLCEVEDGVLKIRDGGLVPDEEINSPADFFSLFGASQMTVCVDITVPEGVLLEKLKVETGMGNVLLNSLDVEKKLEVEAGLGNVEAYDLLVRDKVKLKCGTGNVNLQVREAYDGANIDLKVGLGNVEAILSGSERDWEYEAETGLGKVDIDGSNWGSSAHRTGNSSYKLEAESGTGNVNVYFQD